MGNNIKLLKLIIPLNYTWFWSGIWLLYYLRFTDYSGVGVIYGIMFPLGLLLEIPTGAISDLLGKKNTLLLAFIFNALASLGIGLSQNFNQLILSVLFTVIAGALYSGTSESLIYDSLKIQGKENIYDIILSKIEKYGLITASAASILGGFLYAKNVQYPWFARSLCLFIGAAFCLMLKEPSIDSEKFSLKNFINQNKQGFIQIFKKSNNKELIFKLLLILSFLYIITEEIESAFAIEIGFNATQMGILFAALPIISAIAYQFYPKIKAKFNQNQLLTFTLITSIISGLIAPLLTFASGTGVIMYRHLIQPWAKTIASSELNRNLESKYRTTALSTFNLLVNLPYAISPIIIGKLIDSSSASSATMYLAGLYILLYFTLKLIIFFKNLYARKRVLGITNPTTI